MQTIAYGRDSGDHRTRSPVMIWLAFTGDRAGLRNIQANLGTSVRRPAARRSAAKRAARGTAARKLTPDGLRSLAGQAAGRRGPAQGLAAGAAHHGQAAAGARRRRARASLLSWPSPRPEACPHRLGVIGVRATSLPDILIRNHAEKRREAIRLELPNALDQMLISVQAGLGFEAAMARAGAERQRPAGRRTDPDPAGHPGGPLPQGSLPGDGRAR